MIDHVSSQVVTWSYCHADTALDLGDAAAEGDNTTESLFIWSAARAARCY